MRTLVTVLAVATLAVSSFMLGQATKKVVIQDITNDNAGNYLVWQEGYKNPVYTFEVAKPVEMTLAGAGCAGSQGLLYSDQEDNFPFPCQKIERTN